MTANGGGDVERHPTRNRGTVVTALYWLNNARLSSITAAVRSSEDRVQRQCDGN